MATAAAKAPEAAGEAPKKSKLPLIIILVVVLLAGAGGAAWFFLMRGQGDEEEQESKAAQAKPSVFLPLDQFTVNLQPEDGQQFLQVAMTLKVVDQHTADAIKAAMPEVRSRVLLLLSSKKPSQLSSLEGKNKLANEVIREVEQTMPVEKKKKKKKKKTKAEESAEKKDAKGSKEAVAESKEGKSKKSKAKEESEEDADEDLPERVLAVFFTHFIVQ